MAEFGSVASVGGRHLPLKELHKRPRPSFRVGRLLVWLGRRYQFARGLGPSDRLSVPDLWQGQSRNARFRVKFRPLLWRCPLQRIRLWRAGLLLGAEQPSCSLPPSAPATGPATGCRAAGTIL